MSATDESCENEFYAQLEDIMCKSVTGTCIALGSSLGIFDIMSSYEKPQTIDTIAAKGNWKPRYIKEWLNTMVCSNIVEYNKEDDTYFLPEYRRPLLSKLGGSKNYAVVLELLPVINGVYEQVESCLDKDGPDGISMDHYTGFHEWKSKLEDGIVSWKGLYSVLQQVPDVLEKMENGATICDGGCSSGHFSMAMAESLPNSKIVGFDISSHAIQLARSKAEQKGLTNVSFEEVDACNLPTPWERAFDIFVTINVVHDLPFPEKFLQGIRAALKPGGMIFMVESYLHSNVADSKHFSYAPWFYGVSLFHCVPVSLDAGKGAAGLGCTWGIEHQKEILETTGFVDVKQIQKGLVSYNIAFKPKPDQ